MAPGQYTELFFLDEATALAAGHRPCATCRRPDYGLFKEYWVTANPDIAGRTDGTMAAIDRILQTERVDGAGRKRTWSAALGALPGGTLVALAGGRESLLLNGKALHPWTPAGYGSGRHLAPDTVVQVLTPRAVVKVLALRYRPVIHPTAAAPVAELVTSVRARTERAAVPRGGETMRAAAPARAPVQEPVPSPAGRVKGTSEPMYRLAETPAGKTLYTYFAAILSVTGMDQGAVYPLNKLLGNFSGHTRAGRIEKVPGGYRLTPSGRDYFADRLQPGNPQHIDRHDVEAMARLIRTGRAGGWVPVD
jgi:hypothetical protein